MGCGPICIELPVQNMIGPNFSDTLPPCGQWDVYVWHVLLYFIHVVSGDTGVVDMHIGGKSVNTCIVEAGYPWSSSQGSVPLD